MTVPFSRRGNGFEEYIKVLRAVWGPDPVSFSGRFYRVPESKIGSKPLQPGGPPIIAGGHSPVAFERAGRIADGLTLSVGGAVDASWEALNQRVNVFRNAAQAIGRNPDALEIILRINRTIAEEPIKEPRLPLTGSVEQIVADMPQLYSMNVNHIFFDMSFSQIPVDTQLRLERLQDAI